MNMAIPYVKIVNTMMNMAFPYVKIDVDRCLFIFKFVLTFACALTYCFLIFDT